MSQLPQDIDAILARYTDPDTGSPLPEADIIRAKKIENGHISFILEFKSAKTAREFEADKAKLTADIEALAGANSVQIMTTAPADAPAPPSMKIGRHPTQDKGPTTIDGIKKIYAIGSGKGGVGKSTVTANLAVALAAQGKRVGLLDADVYGPSQPLMLGIKEKPKQVGGHIQPITAHGVKVISLGLMIAEDEAIIWRGPMLMGALQQLLTEVNWGELDVLLVDLPPGTGDIQLSLTQKANVNGGIVVTTPQDVALLDARRALTMFDKLKTPVLGLIENMAIHVCSQCGHEEHIFGEGGGASEAEKRGLPLLGQLPLSLRVREAGDQGLPIVLAQPDSVEAKTFNTLAERMISGGVI